MPVFIFLIGPSDSASQWCGGLASWKYKTNSEGAGQKIFALACLINAYTLLLF